MHLLTKKNMIVKNLNIVEKAIPLKTTMPLIKGIFLEAKNNNLTILANNLELSIMANLSDLKVLEEGSIVLPAELVELLKQAPDEEIEIKKEANAFRTKITSGKAVFYLYGMDPEEFPRSSTGIHQEQQGEIEFSANELKNMLKKVNFAVSHDESKPSFRGILFEAENKENNFKCLASDTYRLAYFQKHLNLPRQLQSFRLLVPFKTLNEIYRILDDSEEKILCSFQENEIIFNYQQFIFYSRLLENKYPELSNIFPDNFITKISVNTSLLEKSVMRASLLAQGFNQMIALQIKGHTLQVSSQSEVGKMYEELPLENKEGEDLDEILLNGRYLLDPLRILEQENVEIEFNGPFGPCIIKDNQEKQEAQENYRYLLLPIKIDKANI